MEQFLDLRVTLRCLGVPLRERICMLGDNDSAANSGMTPHRKTHERNVALSFHSAREATVAKIISFNFIN